MNKYEFAVILKANLDGEVIKEETEKISALIERFGGTVEKIDEWGKRRLAYEINKANEGYYQFYTFTSDVTAPIEIENRIRINENVIRYLILRQDA